MAEQIKQEIFCNHVMHYLFEQFPETPKLDTSVLCNKRGKDTANFIPDKKGLKCT